MATKTGITAAEVKADQLYGIVLRANGEAADYSDSAIEAKIRAAEDFYEKNLHLALGVRKYVSGAQQRGITLNPDAAIPEIEEPGYDYHPDMWAGQRWFSLPLNQRPIVPAPTPSGLIELWFAFPSPKDKMLTVPHEWIRVDFKQGQINIIPGSGAILAATFGAWFIALATGQAYGVPKTIYVDYFAGYDPARLTKDHADLLEGIKLRSLLLLGGIINNIRAQGIQSTSLSIDGLSHSRGFGGGKYGTYTGAIQLAIEQEKEIRDSFNDHEKGVLVAFL